MSSLDYMRGDKTIKDRKEDDGRLISVEFEEENELHCESDY